MNDDDIKELLLETERQARGKALQDAADYLLERAEKLKQQQRRDFSGERDRNINALKMWARQVQRL